MRTNKTEWLLDVAERCSQQGTCLRRNYGAVIVDINGTVVSTGYTGAPCTTLHCKEIGYCWRQENNIPSGSNYNKCRSVHAEMNALMQAGKNTVGATMYISGTDATTGKRCGTFPCFLCAKMIMNSGIVKIVVRDKNSVVHVYTPLQVFQIREKEELGITD